MNEEDSTNIIINSNDNDDSVNNQVWGTWEELILTSAVKRHGLTDWDSVAKEITSRSSLLATAGNCRLKYQDLTRRFQDSDKSADAAEDNLRSLRVAELRREVERCDESILSLQLKVKRLEEKEEEEKVDLREETKPVRLNRDTTESNRSMNESNSTGDHKPVKRNPDPEEGTVSKGSGMSDSGELGESGTSRKRRKYRSVGGSGGEMITAGDDDDDNNNNKSQPLIDFIHLIRSHPRGSVFESRLRSQETKEYKRVIREHLDLKTVEKKLEKGSYVSSSLSFYRDLKLLFTNAIVFYPQSSSESVAAHELRALVSNEISKLVGKSGHGVVKAEAECSVSKRKSSAPPLVVCKRKSSGSKKTSPTSSSLKKDEKKMKEDSEEKTVTTSTTTSSVARSSRRRSKGVDVVAKKGRGKNNNKKQTDSKTESSTDDEEKEEAPKAEKKVTCDKKKSVADFLKRIKKNSPQKGKETTSKDQKKNDANAKKKNTKAKPRELRSSSTGKKKVEEENNSKKSSTKRKQPKKAEEVTPVTGKRGRESGKDSNKQQPKKRTRR